MSTKTEFHIHVYMYRHFLNRSQNSERMRPKPRCSLQESKCYIASDVSWFITPIRHRSIPLRHRQVQLFDFNKMCN